MFFQIHNEPLLIKIKFVLSITNIKEHVVLRKHIPIKYDLNIRMSFYLIFIV